MLYHSISCGPHKKFGWFGQFVAFQIVEISDLKVRMFRKSKLREFPDLSTEPAP